MKKVPFLILATIIVITAALLFMRIGKDSASNTLKSKVDARQDLVKNEDIDNESTGNDDLSENRSKTLMEKNIFKNAEQERLFKSLVGNYYSLFVETFQLITENEDLDGFGAKVYSGNVRGLFTIMEAIVMVAPENRFWVAIIDEDKVVYFTNVKGSNEKLPYTIDKWRERFKEKEIIFEKNQ